MPPSTAGALRRAFDLPIPAAVPDSTLLRVHPTMLYSAITLLGVAASFSWLRRRNRADGRVFALYLVLAGLERFLVEFLRARDDRFLWAA